MRLVIATLVALCISGSAFAHKAGHTDLDKEKEKKSTVLLEKIGEKKIQLKYLSDPNNGKIMVRIKDDKSGVIFRDIIKTDKVFKKNYDMSALAEGSYEFEVYTKEHGTIDNFKVMLGEKKKEASKYFTKVKVIDEANVALLVKSSGASKKYVRILNKGHVIYEDTFEGTKYGKLFKFEKVDSLDDLVFEVRDDEGYGKYLSVL